MRSVSAREFFRVLSVSLLLTVGMPLMGCDQVGQNQGEEFSGDAQDLIDDLEGSSGEGTTRLLANDFGYVADYNDNFAIYYEPLSSDSEQGAVIHSCNDTDDDGTFDTYTREENAIRSASVNEFGNLVTTREAIKAEGRNYSSEGQEEVIEYLDIYAETGASTFEVVDTPENYEGIIDVTEATNGVPESVSDCKNLDQFDKDVSAPRPTGTWRLLFNSGGFDARDSDNFALFYDFDESTKNVDLHSCTDTDGDDALEHTLEEADVANTSQSPEGNTVVTEDVTKAEGVIYDSESTNTTDVEYLSTKENVAWWWVKRSKQSNIEGNVDVVEKTSGVPTTDQQCQNRDQFIQ